MRLFGSAYVLLGGIFLVASAYWPQYNSHLAVSECALAGIGAAHGVAWLESRLPGVAAIGGPVALLASAATSLWIIAHPQRIDPDPTWVARNSEKVIRHPSSPEDVDCVGGLSPALYLALDRLPPRTDRTPLVVDSYATMLLSAMRTGAGFESARQAFKTEAAQAPIRKLIKRCSMLIFGWRANYQLNRRSMELISSSRQVLWATPSGRTMLLVRSPPVAPVQ